ncbi:uncharacterized protein LOC123007268 isoform X2 [Tribolium madens]|uniref:uncharacterized protein LOC123007268 isoform X2 n=1 Tax=Tribolium madens TaxID=41895 RepID=UPI001CF74372|nr:uncharacterized protein LOC123007268 isoform X2 [Tribolium madens]
MSTIDTPSYAISSEKDSGDGEINRYKSLPCGSSSSQMIISEIMNDIVDNAFEVIVAKNFQPPKPEKITPNVVGDIIDNILSPSSNTNASNENYRQDETALLDDEIKRIIKEMKYPSDQKSPICTQGVGDQLGDKSKVAPDKIVSEPVKRNTLERKNRLTNLVRHSKQMLAKLVTNETESDVRMTKSEEIHEKLLKVIDLEGNEHKNFAEGGSSSATGILRMPPESSMNMVDLEPSISQVDDDINTETAKNEEDFRSDDKKFSSVSKKKWNFGTKIMKYFKRNKDSKRE